MKVKLVAHVIWVVVILATIAGCNFSASFPPQHSTALGATSAAPLEQAFVSSVGADVDLNRGIEMVGPGPHLSVGQSTSDSKVTPFYVLNHTNEAVTFPDQSFGMTAFWADSQTGQWHAIHLMPPANPKSMTLAAKLERYDPAIGNDWFVSASQFNPGSTHNPMRVYVQGTGLATGKKYGAYLDISLGN